MNLASSFATLLKIHGENVTFRDKTVRALVNRTPISKGPPSAINISTEVGAVIQFPLSVTKPEEGEDVKDSFNIVHRLTKPGVHFGHCWNCECTTAA